MLIIITTVVFFTLRIIPGGPAEAVLGNQATAEAIKSFNEEWGLNQPLYAQYLRYIIGLLHGDLGRSFVNGSKITPMIIRALPYSILLSVAATIISILIGLPIGIISAIDTKAKLFWDNISRILALIGISMPDFYFGILLIILFSLNLHWFPMHGAGEWYEPIEIIKRIIMPATTLGFASSASIMRITRSSILEVLTQDYIRTAHSKGLNETTVLWKHALKNALIPIISIIGVNMSLILGNVIVIEIIFSRPGIGKLLIGSVMDRDYTVIQSTIIIFAFFITFINLLTDIAYAYVNPRIRLK